MSLQTSGKETLSKGQGKNFLVFNASAGSGKTFTLVREYLRLALSGDNPNYFRKILAITFTRKAAAEMKERVLHHLRVLSADPLSPLYDPILLEEYRKVLSLPNEMIRMRSERALKAILHNYSELSVSTIDSFVHLIIRTFSRDLQLPMDFDVVMEKETIVDEAVDRLVDDAGKDERITVMLNSWLQQNTSEGDRWDVANLMKEFANKVLFREDSVEPLVKLSDIPVEELNALILKLKDQVNTFRAAQVKIAEEIIDRITQKGLSVDDFSYKQTSAFAAFFKVKAIGGRLEELKFGTRFTEVVEKDNWFSADFKKKNGALVDEVRPFLNDAQEKICAALQDATYFAAMHLYREIHQVLLLHEIRSRIETIKEERDLLFIDDFNRLVSALVKYDPAPFIYERVGERYDHIMIDEFQDTSVMQWHNFIPLVENTLAMGKTSLIVGDGKQSIYRFRNGEVEQFACLPHLYGSENEPLMQQKQWLFSDQFEFHTLDTNYRSGKVIVDFNNSFFSAFRRQFPHALASVYDHLEQKVPNNKEYGFVSIRFSSKELKRKQLIEEHAAWLLQSIETMHGQGYAYSDICVLVRSNAEGDHMAAALARAGVPVVSPDSLLIRTSQKVQMIASVIRWMTRPEDEENNGKLAELLIHHCLPGSNFYPLLDKASTEYKGRRTIDIAKLFEVLQLKLNTDEMLRFSLYQLAEYLISSFSLERDEAFMNAFLDQVFSFSQRENDLHAFEEWWKEKSEKLSVQLPDSSDAVKVMTIHKSKGLQFPVVIMPLLTWWDDNKKGKQRLWVELDPVFDPLQNALFKTSQETFSQIGKKEIYEEEVARTELDRINSLYVAFTRAEEQLLVFSQHLSRGWASSLLKNLIPEISDETSEYTLGTSKKVKNSKRSDASMVVLKPSKSINWQERLRISYESQRAWGESAGMVSIRLGNLVHLVLSKLKNTAEIDTVLRSLEMEIAAAGTTYDGVKAEMNKIFSHPFLKESFAEGNNAVSELELIDASGTMWRPDRVVFFKDRTIVLDFKTGKQREEHKQQVAHYGKLLSEMGYPSVENYLFYTFDSILEKVA
ncbi:MAG: UvrD-helicase domain-containing protein [Flavobacteriales bacterium]